MSNPMNLIEIEDVDGSKIIMPTAAIREIRSREEGWVVTLEPIKGVKSVSLEITEETKKKVTVHWHLWLEDPYI